MPHSLARDFGYFMGNVIWAQKSMKERKYMGKNHYMKDQEVLCQQLGFEEILVNMRKLRVDEAWRARIMREICEVVEFYWLFK